jgi:L-ascorbate metabolism protein UlaG (beta-lactamase superfamily)
MMHNSSRKEINTIGKRVLSISGVFLLLSLLFFSSSLPAAEIGKGVKVTFLGHAAFKLVSHQGLVILIDPFLKNNPKTPAEMKEVDKADIILPTHGHADHLGDTVAIARKTGATVVAMAELATYLTKKEVKLIVMNPGQTIE